MSQTPSPNPEKKPQNAVDSRIGRTFINSPWRYSQFVIVGLIVMGLVGSLSPLGWLVSAIIGAAAGIGLWLVEKKRGVL
ncbi:hypothetical protein CO614_04495 [Lysobacteraceae bacterium NML120232]|nr:hypothetical protein CO608_03850 [Xanthomonadaceae bacterium NML08-0793]PJK12542.1 hypothetical protein CO614_04495 [Xanthomonadaceae bacterium NML120232]